MKWKDYFKRLKNYLRTKWQYRILKKLFKK